MKVLPLLAINCQLAHEWGAFAHTCTALPLTPSNFPSFAVVDGRVFVAVACVITQLEILPLPAENETLTVIVPAPELNAVIAPVIQFVAGLAASVMLTH